MENVSAQNRTKYVTINTNGKILKMYKFNKLVGLETKTSSASKNFKCLLNNTADQISLSSTGRLFHSWPWAALNENDFLYHSVLTGSRCTLPQPRVIAYPKSLSISPHQFSKVVLCLSVKTSMKERQMGYGPPLLWQYPLRFMSHSITWCMRWSW